ncbi:MAG: F0F1 ATP synthase subunit A [Acidobacteria bacterium]|nr:F0F1 ATP synthase subunit A [Acidobacteriota bacterium]
MENLHHTLWIVEFVNRLLGPFVASLRGIPYAPGMEVIPDYLVMCGLILVLVTVFSLLVRSTFSVDNPNRLQIVLEDIVNFLTGLLKEHIGPKGPQFLPVVGAIFIFIFLANMIGKIPGLMSPTANINVTLGCALTVWVYYHLQGFKAQGPVAYVKHFIIPPGVPLFVAPIMAPIELISHASRVMSLSLRLFGNIYGEELVILIMASIVPFLVPLPMMFLGVITGSLQAYIFALLTIIYLAGAVHVEQGHDDAHHDDHHAHGDSPAHAHAAA